MPQKTKRRWLALSGGIVFSLLIWLCTSRAELSGAIASLFFGSAVAAYIHLFLRSNDINEAPIVLSAGETLIGRTPMYFYFREKSWLCLIKRYPVPFGGSLILTDRRIVFYYDNAWYDEILMKDLIAVEWFENQELNFRFRQGGVERALAVMIAGWRSYDPLLQLISKTGTAVHQMPARPWGTPN